MLPEFDDDAVAKDIEAVCSKCGESWHVIVAVADKKIAQVQCKSCGAYHKYRPVAADRMSLKKSTKTAIAASSPEAGAASKSKTARASKSAEPKAAIPAVKANARPVRPYSIKSIDYQLGDRIEHVKFGAGIVDEFPAPGKMYVTFATERRLLVYGK